MVTRVRNVPGRSKAKFEPILVAETVGVLSSRRDMNDFVHRFVERDHARFLLARLRAVRIVRRGAGIVQVISFFADAGIQPDPSCAPSDILSFGCIDKKRAFITAHTSFFNSGERPREEHIVLTALCYAWYTVLQEWKNVKTKVFVCGPESDGVLYRNVVYDYLTDRMELLSDGTSDQ